MLQITDDKVLSTQAIENKKNQRVPSGIIRVSSGRVGGSFENLSTIIKSAKSKKSKLTKSKKSNLAKANSSGTDFLTFGAKKAFIHL